MFKSKAKRLFGGAKQHQRHQQQQQQNQNQGQQAEQLELEQPALAKQEYFDFKKCHRTYSCAHCRAHLADHDQLVSKLFQGNHGRAYLFNKVVNIGCKPAVQRELLTGLHAVADIYCDNCETTLGWKYEQAFVASQKYKEGKYIIELAHMLKENNWDLTSYNTCELMREARKKELAHININNNNNNNNNNCHEFHDRNQHQHQYHWDSSISPAIRNDDNLAATARMWPARDVSVGPRKANGASSIDDRPCSVVVMDTSNTVNGMSRQVVEMLVAGGETLIGQANEGTKDNPSRQSNEGPEIGEQTRQSSLPAEAHDEPHEGRLQIDATHKRGGKPSETGTTSNKSADKSVELEKEPEMIDRSLARLVVAAADDDSDDDDDDLSSSASRDRDQQSRDREHGSSLDPARSASNQTHSSSSSAAAEMMAKSAELISRQPAPVIYHELDSCSEAS